MAVENCEENMQFLESMSSKRMNMERKSMLQCLGTHVDKLDSYLLFIYIMISKTTSALTKIL